MKIDRVITGYLEENCYILTIDSKCLVIDPGDDYPLIEKKIGGNKVLAILLTHDHFDHIGAVDEIKEKYKAPIYSYSNLKEGNFNIKDFNFEVIYTPGHKEDSITIYLKKENIMFTGDFIFKGTIGRMDLPGGSYKDMQESLNKISKYDRNIKIYPGHGEETILKNEIDLII